MHRRHETNASKAHRESLWQGVVPLQLAGPGASLAVPLTSKRSIWDFDHMDAAEISIGDAPHPDEIVVILALGIGGRPRKRTKPDA